MNAMGNPKKAEEHFREALRLDPKMAYAYNGLGLVLEHDRRLADALRYFRSALQFDRDFTAAAFNVGSTLRQLGEYDEARSYLSMALNLAIRLDQVGMARAAQNLLMQMPE